MARRKAADSAAITGSSGTSASKVPDSTANKSDFVNADLLEKVKANLILTHSADDTLLCSFITAAVSYAESYQHLGEGAYANSPMPPTTEQAVIMLASHFYESRDGSTAGYFGDNVQAGQQVWNAVNMLLRLNRNWKV